jgi:hypothetical protein
MNYKQFLANQEFWKQAYCSCIPSEISPDGRAKFADKAVDMFCSRLEKAMAEKVEAETAELIAPNLFE